MRAYLYASLLFLLLQGCEVRRDERAPAEEAPAAPAPPPPGPEEAPAAPEREPENERVKILANGLIIEDLVVGSGSEVHPGMKLSVHYTGWLVDGTKFDSSVDRGTPFSFKLGAGHVIAGWEQGIVGMKIGGKRKLTIPPALAYGDVTRSPSPPRGTLIFEVELLGLSP